MSKSYWSKVSLHTDRDKAAVRSWFTPVCDDMEPLEAEILCDVETDKEKKVRAIFQDQGGKKRAIRTLGNNYSITLKPLNSSPPQT